MKNKLAKIRFEKDLKRIRKVLNEVIFISPIQKGKSLEDICNALVFEFIDSVQHAELFGPKRNDGGLYVADVGENPSRVHVAEVYLELFSNLCETGCGFTPRLAIDKREFIFGYNCLGKALALGSFLMIHKIGPNLVLSGDHAMVMFVEDGVRYLCDPSNGNIHTMHGTFIERNNYVWYVSNDEDDFHFNYLVIQDFEAGGMNAIFETLEFLARTGWKQGALAKSVLEDCEVDLFNIMDPQLSYREKICSIDWKTFRGLLFEGMDDYKKDYAKEWLLEAERIRQRRIVMDLKQQFDDAVFHAVRATRFRGKLSEFHDVIIPQLKPVTDDVVEYLTMEFDPLSVRISEQGFVYLKTLKDSISHDQVLKYYAISKIQSKLLDTTT